MKVQFDIWQTVTVDVGDIDEAEMGKVAANSPPERTVLEVRKLIAHGRASSVVSKWEARPEGSDLANRAFHITTWTGDRFKIA